MTTAVRLLSGADAPALRRLLNTDPISNAMVLERTAIMGVGTTPGAEVWGSFEDDVLTSALYVGANVVPVAADAESASAFASRAKLSPRRCSSIVGPSQAVHHFYDGVSDTWGVPREIRPHQPMLAIDSDSVLPADPRVRLAQIEEIDVIFPACVAMFTEELGISPLSGDGGAGYRRRVAGLIRQGRTYVIVEDEEVVFKAEVGVATEQVAQIQGVWVSPHQRGHRISESAMAAVVNQTRQRFSPTVSLYVNEFNHAAIASYRRAGFTQVGEFATVLY